MKKVSLKINVTILILSFVFQSSSALAISCISAIEPEDQVLKKTLIQSSPPVPETPGKPVTHESTISSAHLLDSKVPHADLLQDPNLPEDIRAHFIAQTKRIQKLGFSLPTTEQIAQTQAQVQAFNCTSVTEVSQIECEALVALYNSTDGASWSFRDNWLENDTMSTWYGVDVWEGHIVGIYLRYNNLHGSLPSETGDLIHLYSLVISDNNLTGRIPESLINLTILNELDISYNFFETTGYSQDLLDFLALNDPDWLETQYTPFTSCNDVTEIPKTECDALVELYNSTNGTSWTNNFHWLTYNPIDAWYGVYVKDGHVSSIGPQSNNLVGTIPNALANLTQLRLLYLTSSNLSGEIPLEFGNLRNLENLSFFNQKLTGNIPPFIGDLTKLRSLNLGWNYFTGSIPSNLGNLANLNNLNLSRNYLTGSIPSSLANLPLFHLDLGGNRLTGTIPPELGNFKTWIDIDLSQNQLSGRIPPELGNIRYLTELRLNSNDLYGSIPPELGNLFFLKYLFLHNNHLTNRIPTKLGNLASLETLWLDGNDLVGSIPVSFIKLTELRNVNVVGMDLCIPNTPDFVAWSNALSWMYPWGKPPFCEPQNPKFLIVPLTWKGSQASFDQAATIQLDNFLDQVPLSACRENVVINKLNVSTQNFSTWNCSANSYGLTEIKDFVRKNLNIDPADYDVILGLVEDSPCKYDGASNGADVIWSSTEYQIVTAHELGHIYGLEDQYCSNQAGSTDPRCNDGDIQNDGPITGDVNWLSASLPYDCPPNGALDSTGSKCCNFNEANLCTSKPYGVCCHGNKNPAGGRSTMSYSNAPEPRGFDTIELAHLDVHPSLQCSTGAASNGSEIFTTQDEDTELLLDINLHVYPNDTVNSHSITITEGRITQESILLEKSGEYLLTIRGQSNEEIFEQSFQLYFDYFGPVFLDGDYSDISLAKTDVSFRVPYSCPMKILNLFHNGELIHTQMLPSLCANYLPIIFR